MKIKLVKLVVLSLILLVAPTIISAQTSEKKMSETSNMYLISAKAGGVNYVSGKVSVHRNGKTDGFLQKGDLVESGETVTTQSDAKAEVLLNPGSYIRLGGNSSFQFISTDLDDLQVQINRGSAILEVIADNEFTVTVKLPNSKFYLISAGVFRVDVLENGVGKISVWKGKAQVGDVNATVVKSGKSATQNGANVAVDKFDRNAKSDFDDWSRDRAKQIAQTNARLMQGQMRQSLLSSFNSNGWTASNGYGLWVQDPFSRSFCFLPFGWGWSSPYGFGYNQSIWSYNPPSSMVAPIYQNPVVSNPSTNNNPGVIFGPQPAGGYNGTTPGNVVTPPVDSGGRGRTESARPGIVERKETVTPIIDN